MHSESSLVPVWVNLPALPIHYFDKHSLFSILSPVGRPLFLDSATAAGIRPSVARVCVEIDVAKLLVPRVWVAVEGESGFWQRIETENLPPYCSFCSRLGHSHEHCNKNLKKDGSRLQLNNQQNPYIDRNQMITHQPGTNQTDLENKEAANISNVIANEIIVNGVAATANETVINESTSQEISTTATVKNGIKTSAAKAMVAEPAVLVVQKEVKNLQHCIIDDDPANAEGVVTHLEISDVNVNMETCKVMNTVLHGEHVAMENQLEKHHGSQSEGSHVLKEKPLSTEQHHLDENALTLAQQNLTDKATTFTQANQAHNNARSDHEQLADKTNVELQLLADNNVLENLYVELRGVEDEVSTQQLVEANQMPTNAGNLSPRIGVLQEKLLESSMNGLNIDQIGEAGGDFRQPHRKGMRAPIPSDRQLRSQTSSKNSFQVLSYD